VNNGWNQQARCWEKKKWGQYYFCHNGLWQYSSIPKHGSGSKTGMVLGGS
jgi:hypothetical protein